MTNSDRSGRRHHLTWVLIVEISGAEERMCCKERRTFQALACHEQGKCEGARLVDAPVHHGERRRLRLVRGGARFGGL